MNDFFKGKKVFITGHTGFKGSWLSEILLMLGADVYGYSLAAPTSLNLFSMLQLEKRMYSIIGDIRDLDYLKKSMQKIQPEIVIHMAAQPIVREAYRNPVYTYETNVMGTVNILEAIRETASVKSVLNVTTDKVYLNKEWEWGYRENEELNGYDPYSNSKSCSELITSSYINSFFNERQIAVSTARAGNVIGGGDFSKDRIIPDCIRAIEQKEDIIVRNPYSIRPYEHVLEALFAYLLIVERQYQDQEVAGSYNIGPSDADCLTTGELVTLFCQKWKQKSQNSVKWINQYDGGPHEANFLKLDCAKIRKKLGWKPIWDIEMTLEKISEWYFTWLNNGDVIGCTQNQIKDYMKKRQ